MGYLDAILLGLVFALAFCPYSGVLYFGMLVPLTVTSTSGLYLPILFAIATGIPVIIFAWIAVVFAFAFFLPIESARFNSAIAATLDLVKWYAQEHVILCLLPAFLYSCSYTGLRQLGQPF